MSIGRAAEDASFWWSCGGGQTSHHGGGGFTYGGGMVGNQYPGAQLQALARFQPQKTPVVKGGAHYYGQQNVEPEMVRRRLRWSKELHDKFVSAVNQLGGACNATPKTIWNIMQVEGLTLFQIKSHLQKYRLGQIPKRLMLRRGVGPANGRSNIEDELPQNESINRDGYQASSDISDMNGYVTLGAQKLGNLNHLGEVSSVKHSENRPPSSAVNRGDPLYFTEWSELLDGDDVINPVVPHLNSSMDDYLNSLGQSSEISFTGSRDSSRSSMMFGSFFDEVERFTKNIEDDLMIDNNVDAPIYVNY